MARASARIASWSVRKTPRLRYSASTKTDWSHQIQPARQSLRLVEFSFALLGWMERDRHDPGVCVPRDYRAGALDEQVGKKRLEPKRMLVLIPMDDFQHLVAGDHR